MVVLFLLMPRINADLHGLNPVLFFELFNPCLSVKISGQNKMLWCKKFNIGMIC